MGFARVNLQVNLKIGLYDILHGEIRNLQAKQNLYRL